MNINDLNDMQRKAVEQTEGPLLVIAGAGSGKTKVLTYRIAYLIEEMGVDPYNILAITFTNKAANEMKERVSAITEAGDEVWVSTFHSMCVRMLRRYADRIGYTNDFTIYDSDDARALMRDIFKRNNIDTKMYKERAVLSAISDAKNYMKSPKDMMGEAVGDYKAEKVANFYEEYQKELKKNNAMDFDDLIYLTVELFEKDKEALDAYANRFRYIMVDEYQDTNTSQFQLVSKLARKWKNLFVVGDDDQSIYKFRGANIKNILGFENTFSGAQVIKLEQNYRSSKNIIAAANAVIRHNSERKDKTLWTDNEEGDKLSLLLFDNAYSEADGIASKIWEMERDGYSYNDFAILYRTNAQSRLVEEKLVLKNLPYRIYGGVNFYQRKEIKDILSYLSTLVNDSDGQAVKRIINVPKRGIGATSIARVQEYADSNDITFWEALQEGASIPNLGATHKKTDAFVELIKSLIADAPNFSLEDLVNELLERTSYIDALAESSTPDELAERQENIDELINKVIDFEERFEFSGEDDLDKGLGRLRAFLEEISLVADPNRGEEVGPHISLMTLHSAKGLEFPVVFMAGMEEGLFPSYMSISLADEDEESLEEERRLAYVGITRARKKLFMTFARERMVNGERHTSSLSRFVREIPNQYIEQENRSIVGDDFGFVSKGDEDSLQRCRGSYNPRNKAMYKFRQSSPTASNPYANVQSSSGRPKVPVNRRVPISSATPSARPGMKVAADISSSGLKNKFTVNGEAKANTSQINSFDKGKKADFAVGDRVINERFGEGTIKAVEDMGRDWLLTVDFDSTGTKKMFAGFINLDKL